MKVLAFTSIRSDYDLMTPLYKLLHDDDEVDFKLIVSGAHLSHYSGLSVEQIKRDGFDVLLEIETLLSSDSNVSRVKSASLLMQNSIETIDKFKPDLMIFAGDREDVLVYAMIGGYLNIPTVHVFAGDHVEDGYIDNPIRHATSKLSSVHFVSLPEHKRRLVRMGENPNRVHVIGNLSLDKFVKFEPLEKQVIKEHFGIEKGFDDFALMIFHPVTEELDFVDQYFENILRSLEERSICAFVSFPNVDPGSGKLLKVIERYKTNDNFIFYKNLERNLFMSIYKQASLIIGNSSSGICEAASLRIPAINIGLRQTGRFADKNVIFCSANDNEIGLALDKALSSSFQNGLVGLRNSYGDGDSAAKAHALIKEIDFKKFLAKIEDPLKVESE